MIGPDRDKLRSYVERIERLKEDQDALTGDIREVYGEAKDEGFDKTALGQVVTIRRKRAKDSAKYEEMQELVALYLRALGDAGTIDASHTYTREAQPDQEAAQKPVAVATTESAAHSAEESAATDSRAKADVEATAKRAGGGHSDDGTPSDEARPAESVSRPSRGGGTPAPVSRECPPIPAELRRA